MEFKRDHDACVSLVGKGLIGLYSYRRQPLTNLLHFNCFCKFPAKTQVRLSKEETEVHSKS